MSIPPAAPMTREEAAWLSGLLDGEGCFDSPRGNPRIRVKMSDLDVILRAADLMGASTHMEAARFEHHKPLMVAQITGDRAASIMRALLPWLGSRRSGKCTEIILAHTARQSALAGRHLKAVAA
ncbi:LAGLIDADG family homing endonuclease [Kribbella sp. CA-293567]|uniref:LAGLIDADG family homing endonuclease n=1 Tax=Kribbella sp. CA-293567 TaxID=3002436 RepID=UPI0022DD6F7A|nr:LAGLIDADG family homing endonuclease [Kribbella sp. CA-293567]WBQ03806.1 LAGLIDADG family homing endonuclease [Kribbella sp. CA-293567]